MLAIIFRKCRGGRALSFRFNGDIVTKQKWQLVLNDDIVTLSKARDICIERMCARDRDESAVGLGEIIKIVPAISGRSNCAVTVPAPAGSAGL